MKPTDCDFMVVLSPHMIAEELERLSPVVRESTRKGKNSVPVIYCESVDFSGPLLKLVALNQRDNLSTFHLPIHFVLTIVERSKGKAGNMGFVWDATT
jgi:hypothetical protein